MADSEADLQKVTRVKHAVTIYVSSVLGAGILVLSGIAARVGGLAWRRLNKKSENRTPSLT